MSAIKKLLYKNLSLENYLRLLQCSYFALYNSGLLRLSGKFDYHYHVKRLIARGDVILDIGANLGYYSIPFARWTGPTGKVLSVEPIPIYNKVFNGLARKYPAITLYSCALGPDEGPVEMVAPLDAGYLQTGHPYVGRKGDENAPGLRFQTEMKNPATLFGGLERLDYIKCDVEGFEYQVLSQMRDLIARLRPKVQVEVWTQNESRMLEMFALLGYNPFRMERGKLVPFADSATDGDIIFVPGPAKA
ncbi:MAG: FkbM family methyltransferase [Rikenellaceae bacterium]|jgi:FkbM family methyltransferase|nr:FkbM family methyltransferase [Rikenellaceae bacterium]